MATTTDRRREIAGASIRIVADAGVRALTHRAVDTRLGLPPGSTSFYARSRRSLLALAASELADRARAEFVNSGMRPPAGAPTDLADVADGIAGFLDRMLAQHRHDIVARYALALEVQGDPELRERLATATFSQPAAEKLMDALAVAEPASAAANLISFLEGLLLDHVLGRRRTPTREERRASVQQAVHHFLSGLPTTRDDDRPASTCPTL